MLQVYALMEQGSEARMVGATKMNEASSRSHAVFIVIMEKSASSPPDAPRRTALGKPQLCVGKPQLCVSEGAYSCYACARWAPPR